MIASAVIGKTRQKTPNTMIVRNNFPVKILLFMFGGSLFYSHVLTYSSVEGQLKHLMKRSVFDAPTFFGASCAGSVEIETTSGDKLIIINTVTFFAKPTDERRCDENRGVRKRKINSPCKGEIRLTAQDN